MNVFVAVAVVVVVLLLIAAIVAKVKSHKADATAARRREAHEARALAQARDMDAQKAAAEADERAARSRLRKTCARTPTTSTPTPDLAPDNEKPDLRRGFVGSIPGNHSGTPVGDAFLLVVAMEVAGRLREGVVGPAPEHDPTFLLGHGGDDRPGISRQRFARHASADGHHHVDDQVGVDVDNRVAVHLQIAERPTLVEDTNTNLRVAGHRLRLAAVAHG